jgi:hypothetical protein
LSELLAGIGERSERHRLPGHVSCANRHLMPLNRQYVLFQIVVLCGQLWNRNAENVEG